MEVACWLHQAVYARLQCLRNAYKNAGILPSQVGYIEAHGTGTAVGDPIELQALGEVLMEGRPAGQRCAIGSVKTNIGHSEAASGMAGLIKAVLCLKYRTIPASLHFHEPNPNIPWEKLPFMVQSEYGPWPAYAQPLIAGINSFGVTGTNAHIVLQEASTFNGANLPEATSQSSTSLLPLSAHSPGALTALVKRWSDFLAGSEIDLADVLYTASTRRSHHEHRLAIVGHRKNELKTAVSAFINGETHPGVFTGRVIGSRKLVFVFPGQGSQWMGMGRQLLAQEPIFRKAIEHCERAIHPYVDWSLSEFLSSQRRRPPNV